MMDNQEQFIVTNQEIQLIKRMCVSWWDCEFGAPAIDCKRPYGNSNVLKDMADILGFLDDLENLEYISDETEEAYTEQVIEEQEEVLLELHSNMQTVLQILIDNLSLEAGTYQRQKYGGKWTKV